MCLKMPFSSAWAPLGVWVSSAMLRPSEATCLSISSAGHTIHRCCADSSGISTQPTRGVLLPSDEDPTLLQSGMVTRPESCQVHPLRSTETLLLLPDSGGGPLPPPVYLSGQTSQRPSL